MKKIFFYFPSITHPAHMHMMENVPKGFSANGQSMMGNPILKTSSNKKSFAAPIASFIEPHLSSIYNTLCITSGHIKKRKFYSKDYDLVHSAQALLDTNLPYVVDFEHAAVFSGFNQYAFNKPAFIKSLGHEMKKKNFKKAIAWSEHAKRSLTNFIDTDKTEVVYPCAKLNDLPKKENTDEKVHFLYIGKGFYEKGAYDTLLAFDKISDKYDIELTIVSNFPPEAERFSKNPKITLLKPQPYEKIKKFYREADVFVFPTHFDTFGFVIPEAFSFSLPVIGLNRFSSPELIDNEKTGLIIDTHFSSFRKDCGYVWPTLTELNRERLLLSKNPPDWYIKKLSEAMERLVLDGKLRRTLSKNAFEQTQNGKFSKKSYKEKMGKIYREALE